MVKIFIYHELNLLDELHEIYMVSSGNGSEKDKMIQKLMNQLRNAAEVTLKGS